MVVPNRVEVYYNIIRDRLVLPSMRGDTIVIDYVLGSSTGIVDVIYIIGDVYWVVSSINHCRMAFTLASCYDFRHGPSSQSIEDDMATVSMVSYPNGEMSASIIQIHHTLKL